MSRRLSVRGEPIRACARTTRPSDLLYGMPASTSRSGPTIPAPQSTSAACRISAASRRGRRRAAEFPAHRHNANGTFYLEPGLIGAVDVIRGRWPMFSAPARSAASCRSAPRTSRTSSRSASAGARMTTCDGQFEADARARPSVPGGSAQCRHDRRPHLPLAERLQGRRRQHRAEHRLQVATRVAKGDVPTGAWPPNQARSDRLRIPPLQPLASRSTRNAAAFRVDLRDNGTPTNSRPRAGPMPGPTIACSISMATFIGTRPPQIRPRSPAPATGRRDWIL